MPLIYSAVARGAALLAEYSVFAGNFGAVTKDYLSKASNSGRFSYTVDNHVFSFISEDGYSARPHWGACLGPRRMRPWLLGPPCAHGCRMRGCCMHGAHVHHSQTA
jgi:hypothetical protein